MRRAVVVFGTTVAALAALSSYKTHVAGIAVASTTPATPTVSASPTASASPSPSAAKTAAKKSTQKASPKPTVTHSTAPVTSPSTTGPTSAAPSKTPTTPPSSAAPAGKSGTFTGPPVDTQYGPVQVSITVTDGKITNANGSLPQGGDSIGQNALPQLNQETLTAQSANIQAVSGATYTSQGYVGSLQQAVNEVGR